MTERRKKQRLRLLSPSHGLPRLALLFGVLLTGLVFGILPARAQAGSLGFNNIVIIAMENQNYGCGSICGAPFIESLASAGTSLSNYQAYAQGIGGCSHGCYEAFTAGQQIGGDGSCPRASSPCQNVQNIGGQLGSQSAMFCEDGCPRGSDHFPWIEYFNTWNSCLASSGGASCNGQTGPSGNVLYNSVSSSGNTAFLNYLNTGSPAEYIWFTPTDNHNMHDNSVSSGDSYIQNLLVGSGSLSSPSTNSIFGSNLWKAGRTLLWLWWDENTNPPQVLYGSGIKTGTLSSVMYDEYNGLHMIEQNFAVSYTTSTVASASPMNDIFGTVTSCNNGATNPPSCTTCPAGQQLINGICQVPATFTSSFTFTPTSPTPGSTVTFTASSTGGTPPYSYQWTVATISIGSGSPISWSAPTVGSYLVTLNAADAAAHTSTSSQTVTVAISGCTNGATNPPSCSTCQSGQVLQNGQCVNQTPPPGSAPLISGFAVGIGEVAKGSNGNSLAFPGQQMSDFELNLHTLQAQGFNGVRADFDSPNCNSGSFPEAFNLANIQTAISLAKFYNFWIIIDYHSYNDIFNCQTSWLATWQTIITSPAATSYSQIVWEPENEPAYGQSSNCSGAAACMPVLTAAYNSFISQARADSDTHWIVIQNICSYGCGITVTGAGDQAGALNGWPSPTDSANHLLYSMHAYLQANNAGCGTLWTTAYDQCDAQGFYNVVSTWQSQGHAILNTENGADEFTNLGGCGFAGSGQPASSIILCGSAGYSTNTLSFITQLYTLYKANNIGALFWTAGDWSGTPGAGAVGALQCTPTTSSQGTPATGFGCSMTGYGTGGPGVCSNGATNPPSCTTCPTGQSLQNLVCTAIVTVSFQPIITALAVTGIIGAAAGVVIYDRRKRQ